jgi:proline dehydrogenase
MLFVDVFFTFNLLFYFVYLAAVGYDAFKLAPYGPVDRLLPYLTRRAQENRAIFAKAEKDRRLHYQALKQRVQLA